LRWRWKILAAVRLSLGQQPDAVSARRALEHLVWSYPL
jgi:hypothetical protein